MKIEIEKTYTLWQVINRLAGLAALVVMVYYSFNDNYDKATFYAILYLIVLIGTLKDELTCDCQEDEEDTSN
jgi:DMSO/TMAO reductase YedYZ heme-binding membrane subunit